MIWYFIIGFILGCWTGAIVMAVYLDDRTRGGKR